MRGSRDASAVARGVPLRLGVDPIRRCRPLARNRIEVEAITMIGQTWTTERVALLKNRIDAGLSCGQIAHEIGVSRNAVIGKVSRLGLSRFKSARAGQPETPKTSRRRIVTQHRMLRALREEPQLPFAEMPLDSAQRRSLLELQQWHCRWPIGEPGSADFGFCGTKQVDGLPYCAAHARMAYRAGTRVNLANRKRVAPAVLLERVP
jgi:GcrA cell cycle regulator